MSVFLEASRFIDLGGWVLETQSLSVLGGAYLMAHGVGRPVEDAITEVELGAGVWKIWALTRDWTAAWGRGTPAGRFEILVDGCSSGVELGTNGEAWDWQYGGEVELEEGKHRISLHDLTGFNGRCQAVYLTLEEGDVPPSAPDELLEYRRKATGYDVVESEELLDLLVVGGGYAGVCTVLSAMRSGVKCLLVQDRGVLGGCGSSEIRVWTGGLTNVGKYPKLGNVSALISPIDGTPGQVKSEEIFEDGRKKQLFREGKDLLLNEALLDVELQGRSIASVVTQNLRTGVATRRRARLYSDCSGDGVLARLCGCETMYGREGRDEYGEQLAPSVPERQVMGHSVLWEPIVRKHPVSFPDIDWGIEFNDENGLKRFNCCWDWETGQYRDQVDDIEWIRDYGLMTVLGNWSWLKNRSPHRNVLSCHDLLWVSAIGGKRESYRVVGEYVLSQKDIEERIKHSDGTAAITWSIDLHYPDPVNESIFGEAFQSCAYHRGIGNPYEIPYRCLVARDVDNLFLGGRIISATHVAFSCIRVMRTLGMLGEVVGMASAVCKECECLPREVYSEHWDQLRSRMERGISMNQAHGYMPGREESYHFMRPVGSVGNTNENVWIYFGEGGEEPAMHPSLRQAIIELGVTHKNGKKVE